MNTTNIHANSARTRQFAKYHGMTQSADITILRSQVQFLQQHYRTLRKAGATPSEARGALTIALMIGRSAGRLIE